MSNSGIEGSGDGSKEESKDSEKEKESNENNYLWIIRNTQNISTIMLATREKLKIRIF